MMVLGASIAVAIAVYAFIHAVVTRADASIIAVTAACVAGSIICATAVILAEVKR